MELIVAAVSGAGVVAAAFLGIIIVLQRAHKTSDKERETELNLLREEATMLRERVINREQRIEEAERDLLARQQQLNETMLARADLERQLADIRARQQETARAAEDKIAELLRIREKMEKDLENLSAKALRQNAESFMKMAQEIFKNDREKDVSELEKRKVAVEQTVKPLQEALEKVTRQMQEVEKSRAQSFSQLDQRIVQLVQNEEQLRRETQMLSEALRKPNVRGAWGELQLRRAVEFAGMVEHCHFEEQVATNANDRPDMIVRLPNGYSIIVDSKAPMQAYLEALQTNDAELKKNLMKRHASQLRDKISQLGTKKYAESFKGETPEFVVLFLPSESLFSVALQEDAELLDYGLKHKVVLATPTTLIALLLAVSCGWQQQQVAENARQMGELGRDLYDRISKFAEHFTRVGDRLGKAVSSYNDAVSSMENRLIVTARKINELGGFDTELKKLPETAPLDIAPRIATAPELTKGSVEHN